MRYLILCLCVALAGCLSVQDPHNPMKRPKKEKKADAAPVDSQTAAKPAPKPAEAPELQLPPVTLMKEMFLVQRDLNQQILKLAEKLSQAELEELNEWLSQYGVQIQRKRKPVVPRPQSYDRDRVY